MAASDAHPIPIKNKAFRVYFPILDADGDLVTGATGLDSERSIDGATFADCTNEATEVATASGMYYLDLTSAEMNADCTCVIVKTTSSGAKTTVLTFYPFNLAEPTAVPGFSNGVTGFEEALAWLIAMARNKMTQTSTTTILRNDADSGTLGTSTVSDDGTTFTRGEFA
jgi:hypothetical protein